jgi:hypothetical protein
VRVRDRPGGAGARAGHPGGLHIGEAELTGEKVGGIAVTTAQRVESAAGPGQVLATDTIVHLVAGSGLEFTDLGSRELKGVPGRWELFSLDAVDGQPVGTPLDPKDAAEARDRSSPPETVERTGLWALLVGLGVVSVVAAVGAVLLQRDRPGSTVTPPTSGPVPAAIVTFREGSGVPASSVDLPELSCCYGVGPILLTGRVDTPEAFAWLPEGNRGCCMRLAQVNRTTGAVVDAANVQMFNTKWTICPCVASAEGRIWTPIASGPGPELVSGRVPGVSLRGIGLEGEPEKDIVVDKALLPDGVSALVSGAGYLWLGASATDQVYRVDPRTSKVVPFALHQSADVLVFAEGSLWALDTLDGKITRVDPLTGPSLPSLPISGDLRGMAVGGGYVWVTDASGNEVQRIQENLATASTPIAVGQIGGQPNGISYDDGAIVVGYSGGALAKINPSNPSSPEVLWTHSGFGNDASSITIDGGIVWAAGGPLSNL